MSTPKRFENVPGRNFRLRILSGWSASIPGAKVGAGYATTVIEVHNIDSGHSAKLDLGGVDIGLSTPQVQNGLVDQWKHFRTSKPVDLRDFECMVRIASVNVGSWSIASVLTFQSDRIDLEFDSWAEKKWRGNSIDISELTINAGVGVGWSLQAGELEEISFIGPADTPLTEFIGEQIAIYYEENQSSQPIAGHDPATELDKVFREQEAEANLLDEDVDVSTEHKAAEFQEQASIIPEEIDQSDPGQIQEHLEQRSILPPEVDTSSIKKASEWIRSPPIDPILGPALPPDIDENGKLLDSGTSKSDNNYIAADDEPRIPSADESGNKRSSAINPSMSKTVASILSSSIPFAGLAFGNRGGGMSSEEGSIDEDQELSDGSGGAVELDTGPQDLSDAENSSSITDEATDETSETADDMETELGESEETCEASEDEPGSPLSADEENEPANDEPEDADGDDNPYIDGPTVDAMPSASEPSGDNGGADAGPVDAG
ncbi:hypothetical protein [Parasphingorhabdus sp.]|uniref:hypothetical protein n=1 Tax=Parasphingorhabdus sp. TaxID=2709688 RepID=UPI003BAE1625